MTVIREMAFAAALAAGLSQAHAQGVNLSPAHQEPPTPEQAAFSSLVQQYTAAQRDLAMAVANNAALSATIARERTYWAAWVAGDAAKAAPEQGKVKPAKKGP